MTRVITRCILIIMLCCLVWIPLSYACDKHLKPPVSGFDKGAMQVKTADGNLPFNIEIARTPEQMEYGLMNRTSLPEDYAMLFMFSADGVHSMWMKDTPLSLDMLFVDRHGKIVYIERRAVPESLDEISVEVPVRVVVEMLGGTADRKNIQVGDHIIHPYFVP